MIISNTYMLPLMFAKRLEEYYIKYKKASVSGSTYEQDIRNNYIECLNTFELYSNIRQLLDIAETDDSYIEWMADIIQYVKTLETKRLANKYYITKEI